MNAKHASASFRLIHWSHNGAPHWWIILPTLPTNPRNRVVDLQAHPAFGKILGFLIGLSIGHESRKYLPRPMTGRFGDFQEIVPARLNGRDGRHGVLMLPVFPSCDGLDIETYARKARHI